jgi:hypothetical protein
MSLTLEASVGNPAPESFAQPESKKMPGAKSMVARREFFNFIA